MEEDSQIGNDDVYELWDNDVETRKEQFPNRGRLNWRF